MPKLYYKTFNEIRKKIGKNYIWISRCIDQITDSCSRKVANFIAVELNKNQSTGYYLWSSEELNLENNVAIADIFHKLTQLLNWKGELLGFVTRKKIWLNQIKWLVWRTFFDLKKWFVQMK